MRKSSPQHQTPKGPDKPSSPRLTLRFQPIKSRDDRHGGAFKSSEVTSSEPRYQSYCVTMESADDVYEFKKEDAQPVSSTRTSSTSVVSDGSGHFDQQLNVVSSSCSKDLQSTATSVRLFNQQQQHNSLASDTPSKELNSRVRLSDNHSGSSSSSSNSRDKHKVEAVDGDVTMPAKSHTNNGSSNHVRTDTDETSEDEGKRKRKRDSKEEPTNSKTNSGMSLRNHSRDKGSVGGSSEERMSPSESSALLSSVVVSSATASKPPVHISGSENENTQGDGEHEVFESAGTSQDLPKVPPLKIVIPPTALAEQDRSRVASRHSLPYVVNTSGDLTAECSKVEGNNGSGNHTCTSDVKESPSKDDSKLRDSNNHLEERSHRVTRSSQRMAAMASATVSLTTTTTTITTATAASNQATSDYVASATNSQNECGLVKVKCDQGGGGGDNSAEEQNGPDVPPRKRKLRSRDGTSMDVNSGSHSSSSSTSSVSSHCDEQSVFLNCYEMFLNLRRQIDRRRTSMFVVQPKPPQGFKDYLMNKCSYVLAGNAASRLSVPMIPPPQSLSGSMKELYMIQEKARYNLRLQHIIEREKLTLSFEQETLRVHGRAARAMANQTAPLSVCTVLKDEEIYNQIEPEQEEKERNARTRFNGRLFLSWLQDVDDKWDKVKKAMLLRHHNEAESLHAAQKLDWEWKMKELKICDFKSTPVIDVIHVPIVHVSDDFDLLNA